MFNLISQNIKSIVQRFFSTAGLILSKNNSSSYIVYSKEFGNLLGYKICVKSTADYWFNVSDKYKKLEHIGSIAVIGHGASGSSAVYDYLLEFRGVIKVGESEFRFIKDRGGLLDLESMWKRWSHWNCKSAVDDFRYVMKMHYRKSKYRWLLGNNFCVVGLGSNTNLHSHVEKFIRDISLFNFNGHWIVDKNNGLVNNTIKKVLYKLNRSNFTVLNPSVDFHEKAKLFIKEIVNASALSCNYSYVIFDQIVDPANISKCSIMFDNLKSIVVIRDPRDQFISFCENLKEFAPTDVNSFCCLYEQNMRTIDVNNNSIVIRFEDFVMDFERESLKIRKFLGIKIEDHFVEVNLFNKEKSSSRIGKWRNYNDQESIKVIEKKLKDYCYNAK